MICHITKQMKKYLKRTIPLLSTLVERYVSCPVVPPIQIAWESTPYEVLRFKRLFYDLKVDQILCYLRFVRVCSMTRELALLFKTVCQRIKLKNMADDRTIIAYMYILTEFMQSRNREYIEYIILNNPDRETPALMVYLLEHIDNIPEFYYNYLYKENMCSGLFRKIFKSYLRNTHFREEMYDFFKHQYLYTELKPITQVDFYQRLYGKPRRKPPLKPMISKSAGNVGILEQPKVSSKAVTTMQQKRLPKLYVPRKIPQPKNTNSLLIEHYLNMWSSQNEEKLELTISTSELSYPEAEMLHEPDSDQQSSSKSNFIETSFKDKSTLELHMERSDFNSSVSLVRPRSLLPLVLDRRYVGPLKFRSIHSSYRTRSDQFECCILSRSVQAVNDIQLPRFLPDPGDHSWDTLWSIMMSERIKDSQSSILSTENSSIKTTRSSVYSRRSSSMRPTLEKWESAIEPRSTAGLIYQSNDDARIPYAQFRIRKSIIDLQSLYVSSSNSSSSGSEEEDPEEYVWIPKRSSRKTTKTYTYPIIDRIYISESETSKTSKPVRKKLPIKETLANILRDAAITLTQELKEHNRLIKLLQGGSNYQKYQSLAKERLQKEQDDLQQRLKDMHSKGQLTRHAAIHAKKHLVHLSQIRRKQFEAERKKLLRIKLKNMAINRKKQMMLKKGVINIKHRLRSNKKVIEMKKQRGAILLSKEIKQLHLQAIKKKKDEQVRKQMQAQDQRALEIIALARRKTMKSVSKVNKEGMIERNFFLSLRRQQESANRKQHVSKTRTYKNDMKLRAIKYLESKRQRKDMSIRKCRCIHEKAINAIQLQKNVVAYADKVVDHFELELKQFPMLKNLYKMKEKLKSLNKISDTLCKLIRTNIGIRLNDNLSATDKATVDIKFLLTLEKFSEITRPEVARAQKPHGALSDDENVEYFKETIEEEDSLDNESIEMKSSLAIRQEKLRLKQQQEEETLREKKRLLMEEEAIYIESVMGAVQEYLSYYKKMYGNTDTMKTASNALQKKISAVNAKFTQLKKATRKRGKKKPKNKTAKAKGRKKIKKIKVAHKATSTPSLHIYRPSTDKVAQKRVPTVRFFYCLRRRFYKKAPVISDLENELIFEKLKSHDRTKKVQRRETIPLPATNDPFDDHSKTELPSIKISSMPKRRITQKKIIELDKNEINLNNDTHNLRCHFNRLGKPTYELVVKDQHKFIWEWVPVYLPENLYNVRNVNYKVVPPAVIKKEARKRPCKLPPINATKEHNIMFPPAEQFTKTPINSISQWKKKQTDFRYLNGHVRDTYLQKVLQYVRDHHKKYGKHSCPKESTVCIPLLDDIIKTE